ncbi:uncharacterized protein A4U43_C06F19550 [Asparagus officinalis]|uniref:60S acidic ribosomal protein P1 n=1 Tax=Asparagus officinalis TaxID=4686 RepID=A0A5P1EN00_ASPOF|nr:uncharacterized protein A4U43_C06F19550 [Asparagus officinalis]
MNDGSLGFLEDRRSSRRRNFPREEMSTAGELACSYAAIILYDDGIPITVLFLSFPPQFQELGFSRVFTAEKITTLVNAVNVKIESYWPGLFAKLFEKKNIEDLILNVGSSGAALAADAAAAAAPAAEEKKEETKESDDEDMGFSLFD